LTPANIIGNLTENLKTHPPLLLALAAGLAVFFTYIVIRLDFFGFAPWRRVATLFSDRWANLDLQLFSIKKAANRLSSKFNKKLRLSDSVIIILRSIKQIYWNSMRNPLTKALVAAVSQDEIVGVGIPTRERWAGDLLQFFGYLKETLPLATPRPFCGLDIERLLAYSLELPKPDNLVYLNKFMMDNNFEFCFPSFDQGKLNGAIFLGSKRRGIFWPQELRALQMISHQLGTAAEGVKSGHRTLISKSDVRT
jgi:hypothetical protein